MQNPNQKPLDLSLPEDGSIPAFLRRDVPSNSEKEVLPMKTDEDQSELPDADAPAPKAPKKAKPRKPAVKAKGNGKGNGAVPHKASAKAAPKAAAKAKGKARAAPVRDPAKLDIYGFRKGTIKSKAAAMYAKGKGCTLADVKEALGSVQFNLLTEVKNLGFKVDTAEVKNAAGRVVTRYKIQPKV